MMRSSWIIWVIVICGLGTMYMAVYPAFSNDADAVRKIFSNVPPSVRSGLGLDIEALLSFLGFFAFTFLNITLAAGIHAMLTGLGIFSREQRSKTTDFLLSKPRTRTNLFIQKFLAGLVTILGIWVIFSVVMFVLTRLFGAGDFSLKRFAGILFGMLAVQLWLYVFGIFVSQLMKRMKTTVPTALAVVFGFFLVGVVGAILNEPKARYFSPFKFFDYVGMAAGKSYEPVYIIIAASTTVLFGTLAYMLYRKRDIRSAL